MFCDFSYNAVAKSNSDRDSVYTMNKGKRMLYRAPMVRVAMTRGAQAIYHEPSGKVGNGLDAKQHV